MISIKEIIEGHVNELRSIVGIEDEDKDKIFKIREKICLNCPLKNGNTCNKSKFINPETKEVVTAPKAGFVRGCGCRLSAKQKSPGSKCPAGFWGGEFNNTKNK